MIFRNVKDWMPFFLVPIRISAVYPNRFTRLCLRNRRSNKRDSDSNRRGSMLLLASAAFFALVGLAGLCINIAYLELIRTEQRLATDSAAKAALVVLGQTQSASQSRLAAKTIANMHRIGGKSVVLDDADIQIGTSTIQPNGSFAFTPTSSNSSVVTNSVRVNSNLNRLSGGGIPLIVMPQMFGTGNFTAQQSAISTRIEMDVCLVVDRSGSMSWSLGATPFTYPGDLAGQSPLQNYFKLPHATLSRWAALSSSVDVFLSVLNEAPIPTRVALASYSSNFTFGIWTSTVASVDEPLTTTYPSIKTRMNAIATNPLIGNTNIAAGLREGVNALTDPTRSRITSCKAIVLLTDGIKTQGDDPVALATMAREMNIRIHTIAFSAQADVNLMQQVAQAGGGQCYVAPTAASLTTAFRTIAATLPNMLTE
jgi:Ca-activated chloride channel homolog